MDAHQAILDIAEKFGLTPVELRDLLISTDEQRGMVAASEVDQGLRQTVMVYFGVFGSVASRVEDPGERAIVERYLAQATEALAQQLAAAPHTRN